MSIDTSQLPMAHELARRIIDVELLALDLGTCTRCVETLENIETAIKTVQQVLEVTAIDVRLQKMLIESSQQAREHQFVTSPTVRINRRDIAFEMLESACETCTDLCGCAEGTTCRIWRYRGQEFTQAPVGLIVEALAWVITALGSWRLAYGVLGGWLLDQTLVWMVVAREVNAPVTALERALMAPVQSSLKALRAYPQGWLLGITMLALSATWAAIVTFLPTLLLERDHIPPALSGALLGCLYYGLIPSALLGDVLEKKVHDRRLLLWGPALTNTLFGGRSRSHPRPGSSLGS
jgi:hypothetical protein